MPTRNLRGRPVGSHRAPLLDDESPSALLLLAVVRQARRDADYAPAGGWWRCSPAEQADARRFLADLRAELNAG